MNILITGGASGLGESTVRRIAKSQNDKIYFTYNTSIKNAKKMETELKNSVGIKCDFKNNEDIKRLIARISDINLDVLINNAITGFVKKHFHKINITEIEKSFKYNILPVIQITQATIKVFRKKKAGKIITVLSSALVNTPPIGWSEYVANKAYLFSLAKSWATENIAFNITSNCISPSMMQTSLTSDIDDREIETIIKSHPLKRLLTKEEVADAIYFLVHASPYLNGTNSILNSGINVI